MLMMNKIFKNTRTFHIILVDDALFRIITLIELILTAIVLHIN